MKYFILAFSFLFLGLSTINTYATSPAVKTKVVAPIVGNSKKVKTGSTQKLNSKNTKTTEKKSATSSILGVLTGKKSTTTTTKKINITHTVAGRTYITGPEGGCYYVNSGSHKTYVDHSYCSK